MAQGDFNKEEFTDEEKAALGEVDDSTKAEGEGTGKSQDELNAEGKAKTDDETGKAKTDEDGKSKTEQEDKPDAETQAVIEEQGAKLITENGKQYVVDDEGAKIPVERFKKIYGKSKDLERTNEEITNKFNLFKTLGAEKYYELYPQEKPADFKPAQPVQPQPAKQPTMEDIYSMRVTGGKYDGLTVAEVAEQDSVAATILVNNFLNQQREAADKAKRKETEDAEKKKQWDENFKAEVNAFRSERAKELFGKDNDLTEAEQKQIDDLYNKLSIWMITNKKTLYNLEDAYLLANKDQIFTRERVKAAKEALEKATNKNAVSNIGTGDHKAGLTGYDNVLAMSEDQLKQHIDALSEKEFAKFLKEAPKALKDKFPSIPWN